MYAGIIMEPKEDTSYQRVWYSKNCINELFALDTKISSGYAFVTNISYGKRKISFLLNNKLVFSESTFVENSKIFIWKNSGLVVEIDPYLTIKLYTLKS